MSRKRDLLAGRALANAKAAAWLFPIMAMWTGWVQGEVDLSRAWWNPKWRYRQMVVAERGTGDERVTFGTAAIQTEGKSKPDGADIRVVDWEFRNLPRRIVPVGEDGTVTVEFALGPEMCGHYFVYYGNPDAEGEKDGFPAAQSSLLLETRSYAGRAIRSPEDFKEVFESCKEVVGKAYREEIQDRKNPFSESTPRCLAMYSGLFGTKNSGVYGFQIKGTGTAFLTVDGNEIIKQAIASGSYVTNEEVFLDKGSHKLEFMLYSRHPLSYMAEVNWKPPGEGEFTAMSAKNFSSGLDFSTASVEEFGEVLSARFACSIDRGVAFGEGNRLFTRVSFKPMVVSALSSATNVRWDFGDGTESRQNEPVHVYRGEGKFRVTLTAKDECGFTKSCSREVVVSSKDAVKVELSVGLRADRNITRCVGGGEGNDGERDTSGAFGLEVSPELSATEEKDFDFECSLLKDGTILESHREGVTLYPREVVAKEPEKGVVRKLNIPNYDGRFKVRLSLWHKLPVEGTLEWGAEEEGKGFEAARREVNVILDSDPFPVIASYDTNVRDAEGNLVIVKQTEARKASAVSWGNLLRRKGVPLKILVVDNSLAPEGTGLSEGKLFYGILKEELQRRYAGLRVEVKTAGSERDRLGYFPLKRIFETGREVESFRPDVVIMSCDLQDIFNFSAEEKMSVLYGIMINNLIARCETKVVLVTPPPYPLRAEQSKVLSIILQKAALRHNVGVADVFSAVMLSEGDWRRLFVEDGRRDEVWSLYLNTAGQKIIADTILRPIIEGTS